MRMGRDVQELNEHTAQERHLLRNVMQHASCVCVTTQGP